MKTDQFLALYSMVLLLLLYSGPAGAEVESTVVRLSATGNASSYVPPTGKVFVIEHVAFSEAWDSAVTPRTVRWYSSSTGGTFWAMPQTFSGNFNSLLRPVRLSAPSRVAISAIAPTGFQCFLWGLLVDQQDLYAARIPSQLDVVAANPGPGGTTVDGTLTLSSPRPAKVTVETSGDLDQWVKRPEAIVEAGASKVEKTVQVEVTGEGTDQRGFVRAEVRARPRELLAPAPLRIGPISLRQPDPEAQ